MQERSYCQFIIAASPAALVVVGDNLFTRRVSLESRSCWRSYVRNAAWWLGEHL